MMILDYKKMIIRVFNKEEEKPERYSFTEAEVCIGRNPSSECSVVVNSSTISRNHLKARLNLELIQIMDLNSSNGSFLNDERIDTNAWRVVGKEDRVRMGEFEGYLQFQIRQNTLKGKHNSVPAKPVRDSQLSESDSDCESRQRSREKKGPIELPFKLSESTIKMVKDMTLNKKTKEERIKFLKLMGVGKAEEYWPQIEQMLKQKKGTKNSQKTSDQLERQFNLSRSGIQKRGLGK